MSATLDPASLVLVREACEAALRPHGLEPLIARALARGFHLGELLPAARGRYSWSLERRVRSAHLD